MTGDEMRECVRQIGWSIDTLANRSGVRRDTVTGWASNRRTIPENLAEWLIRIRDKISDDLLPEGWEQGRGGGGAE